MLLRRIGDSLRGGHDYLIFELPVVKCCNHGIELCAIKFRLRSRRCSPCILQRFDRRLKFGKAIEERGANEQHRKHDEESPRSDRYRAHVARLARILESNNDSFDAAEGYCVHSQTGLPVIMRMSAFMLQLSPPVGAESCTRSILEAAGSTARRSASVMSFWNEPVA